MPRQPSSTTTTAGAILRRSRRQQRLTQQELAQRAGVGKTVVARYESGRQQPSLAALERLVAVCGYELVWSLRHRGGELEGTSLARFPGPIGQRLTAQLQEVLAALTAAGGTEPRVYGEVADGTEGVNCKVIIGVTLPPGATSLALMSASGFIALLLNADVTVVKHSAVADYGFDDAGVPLTAESGPGHGSDVGLDVGLDEKSAG